MTAPSRERHHSVVWWHILAAVVICVLIYGNSLSGAFVWDDELQIVKNPTIRTLANIPSAFTTPFWGFANAGEANRTNFYRPVQTVAYSLGYWWGDLSPAPDHVISVAFHALACVLLYLICIQLSFSPSISLLAAALFATHPIHTEAVAWIAGIPDVACGAFYLGAFWAFLKSEGDRKTLWLSISSLLFLRRFSRRKWRSRCRSFYCCSLFARQRDPHGRLNGSLPWLRFLR